VPLDVARQATCHRDRDLPAREFGYRESNKKTPGRAWR